MSKSKKVVTDDVRIDKPGRCCVGSSPDAAWLVFVDTKPSGKNRWDCFLWNRETESKVELPRLREKPGNLFKCIVKGSYHCVLFFLTNSCSYIWTDPLSKDWQTYTYEQDRVPRIGRYDAVLYRRRDNKSTGLCIITQCGELRSSTPTLPPLDSPNRSLMYERRLVELDHVVESPEAECFLLERRPQCGWEVFEVDISTGEMRSVHDLSGLTVFLTSKYSIVYRPDSDVERNCICFTEYEDGDDENFYVFRLGDQSLSIVQNQPHSGFPISFARITPSGMPYLRFAKNEPPNIVITSTETDGQSRKLTSSCISERSCDFVIEDNICCKLSDDVQRVIADSLPSIADYENFRLLCRKWSCIAPPLCWEPDFSNSVSVNIPLLMLSGPNDSNASLIDPTSNRSYFISNQDLLGCKIRYSNHGWLLVTQGKHKSFFFEPICKTKIALIDIPQEFYIHAMSFSSPPALSSDWAAIAILSTEAMPQAGIETVHIAELRSGYERWHIFPSRVYDYYGRSAVFHDSKFYCLCQSGRLAVFWFENSVLRTADLWPKISSYKNLSNCRRGFLVSCGDNLYLVVIGLLGKSVNVYMLKRVERFWIKWIEVKSIENYAFFITQTSSFAIPVAERSRQNSINFPLFDENGCCLFYKLSAGEFKLCPGGHYIYDREEKFNGTWLQPKVVRAKA